MARRDRYRRYGSIRILRDGRVRFSPWTFPVLNYISFIVLNAEHITLDVQGRRVMDFDLARGRLVGASFRYDLTPDELRDVVSDLRRAGNGIERWIVPALEFTGAANTFRRDNPKTHAIVSELLESCRELPVAEQWTRVRARVLINEMADEPAKATRPARLPEDRSPSSKPRSKKRERGTPNGVGGR